MTSAAGWGNFYVIVGSSAGALFGVGAAALLLLFVGIHYGFPHWLRNRSPHVCEGSKKVQGRCRAGRPQFQIDAAR